MSHAIPLSVLDDRIRHLDSEIDRLTVERDLLRSLRKEAIPYDGTKSSVQMSSPRKTLTDTVREFVVEHPGLTGPEITQAILDTGLVPGGADPRKTLSTTIGALVQKNKLRRDPATGRHFAP